MKANLKSLLALALTFVTGTVIAAMGMYNCRTMAGSLSPQEGERSFTTVRAWNEDIKKRIVGSEMVDCDGWWQDMGDETTPAASQLGCCWFSMSLTKGRDYVLCVTAGEGLSVSLPTGKSTLTYTKFSQVTSKGKTYCYIRAGEWSPLDSGSTVDFLFEVFGSHGSVGKTFSVMFANKSIDDVIEAEPGSLRLPIDLDVSQSGSRVIDNPPSREPYNRLTTVYAANLSAGESYVFTGTHPSSPNMDVYLDITGWENVPGEVVPARRADGHAVTSLTVSVSSDYRMTLLVMPDDLNWESGNVAGGTLAWQVGIPKGTFRGRLQDVDAGGNMTAVFDVTASLSASTVKYAATVEIDGTKHVCQDEGRGVLSYWVSIAGQPYKCVFAVNLTEDGKLSVSGSAYVDDGGAREVVFDGKLGDGSYVIQYEPGLGAGTSFSQSCEWGKVYGLSTGGGFIPPSGKHFAGWQRLSATGAALRRYDPGMLIFNLAGEAGQPVRLRAIWE